MIKRETLTLDTNDIKWALKALIDLEEHTPGKWRKNKKEIERARDRLEFAEYYFSHALQDDEITFKRTL